MASEYDWWFDDPNNRLYVYAATSPATRYNSVEVPDIVNRTRGIWWGGVTARTYITVDGFEVAFTPGVGVVVRGNSIVTNNYIHHTGDEVSTGHSYGIEIQSGGGCLVSNNIVHNTNSGGIYAVASYSPYINSNTIIELNTVYDCQGGLIRVACRDGYTMENNIIRKNNLYHTASMTDGGTAYGIYIVNNAAGGTPSLLLNNNVINVKYRGISIDNYGKNITIYNNTIKSTIGTGIYVSGTGTSGNVIKNNLISGAGLYALQVLDAGAISACDYNLWYAPTGTAYVYVGTSAYHSDDFATYKSDTGWDAHGLWQDPVVNADFTLQSTSPCINAGTDVGLTTDYAGNVVPKGALPDIGAYEWFVPIISSDMQVLDDMRN